MIDIDVGASPSFEIKDFLSNFIYSRSSWLAMTATQRSEYYDIWALRTLSDTVLNYDVWHRIYGMQFISNYCVDSLIKNTVDIHQKIFPMEPDLLEVRSAFEGAGLYQIKVTEDCDYSGFPVTCEHVPFHTCAREKNQARIFINSRFTNEEAFKTV